ncbi:MAG: hypothetical protein ABIM89_14130, partial [Mycobacteriales bacterium]
FTAVPVSVLQRNFPYMKAAGGSFFDNVESAEGLPFGTPDELVTTRIAAEEFTEAKMAAMRAHRSQIGERSVFFSLPEELAAGSWGVEYLTLVRGQLGERAEDGFESDLFT